MMSFFLSSSLSSAFPSSLSSDESVLLGLGAMVDMEGFGDAPRPDDGRYSPADQAELIHRLVVQRDLKRIFIGE